MKALMLASVASMIDQFNMPNIQLLQSLGYTVDVVADFTNPGTITAERANDLTKRLSAMNVRIIDVPIPRSINPVAIISAYVKVQKLLQEEHYALIHCHSPIGGFLCRLAARKEKNTNVIYTAHGFHFYKGAPIKNWLLFYPVEWVCSFWTDVLITINKEDYERAKKHFHAKKTVYVPGVGIDTKKFAPVPNNREKIRKMLGVKDDQIMLLSVGELNENKNHEAVIRAIQGMENVVYVIVGKGELEDHLSYVIRELAANVILTGFREDVSDFYNAADVFILPSLREGLNVSLMEAMASGLAVACSRIRGNMDLIEDEKCLFDSINIQEIAKAIKYATIKKEKLIQRNLLKVRNLDKSYVQKLIATVYSSAIK